MLCHPEPGSAVSYALQNAKSHFSFLEWSHETLVSDHFRQVRAAGQIKNQRYSPRCDAHVFPHRPAPTDSPRHRHTHHFHPTPMPRPPVTAGVGVIRSTLPSSTSDHQRVYRGQNTSVNHLALTPDWRREGEAANVCGRMVRSGKTRAGSGQGRAPSAASSSSMVVAAAARMPTIPMSTALATSAMRISRHYPVAP